MQRTTDTFRQVDKHGSGKDGFTEGDPGVTAPTNIRAADMDGYQEEIIRCLELMGLTPSGADLGQLAKAIANPHATARFSGSAVADGSNYTISALDVNVGTYLLASNAITVPSFGLYLVTIDALVAASATTNPLTFGLQVDQGGVELRKFRGTRFSATAADKIAVSGSIIWPAVSTFDSLTIKSVGATNGTVASSEGYVSIVRLKSTA